MLRPALVLIAVLVGLVVLGTLASGAGAFTIPGRESAPRAELEQSYRAARVIQASSGHRYPPKGALVRALRRVEPGIRFVVMARRTGAPTRPGVVGVWSDGARSAAFAIRGPKGRVLRLVDRGGRVTRNY